MNEANMWIIVIDELGNKRYVNINYILDFYFDGQKTNIWVNEAPIRVKGDITPKICEVIRMHGDVIKQLGGEHG